jgi:hypothetical protein
MINSNEDIWSAILSRDDQKIIEVINSLSEEEMSYVTTHLHQMISEDGWHPSQIESANHALQVIKK